MEIVDVPDVVVGWRNVPVAHERDLGVGIIAQPGRGLVFQLIKPPQLVRHMLVFEGTPVGDVKAPDTYAVTGRGNGPSLLNGIFATFTERWLADEGALNICKPHPGGNRDTIPLAETEMCHLVPVVFEKFPREVLVLALGFLDGQHVGVGAAQPVLYAVGTGTQRIYIPGSNLHLSKLSSYCRLSLGEPRALASFKGTDVRSRMPQITVKCSRVTKG